MNTLNTISFFYYCLLSVRPKYLRPPPQFLQLYNTFVKKRVLKPNFTTKPPLSKKFAGWKLRVILNGLGNFITVLPFCNQSIHKLKRHGMIKNIEFWQPHRLYRPFTRLIQTIFMQILIWQFFMEKYHERY
jgi:hypothetical protein